MNRFCLIDRNTPACYGLISLLLMADTGVTPLDLPFWVVFAPLIVAGELAIWTLGKLLEMEP